MKDGLAIGRRKFALALAKRRPFMTETGRDVRIDISCDVIHCGHVRAQRTRCLCLLDMEDTGQGGGYLRSAGAARGRRFQIKNPTLKSKMEVVLVREELRSRHVVEKHRVMRRRRDDGVTVSLLLRGQR